MKATKKQVEYLVSLDGEMRTTRETLAPIMQQYNAIKLQYRDVILLFRLGDFYEMFGEDASTAAPILDVVLTGRDAGALGRIPMCGVPYHAIDKYIARLIAAGHRVAVCDQVEEQRKGIMDEEE